MVIIIRRIFFLLSSVFCYPVKSIGRSFFQEPLVLLGLIIIPISLTAVATFAAFTVLFFEIDFIAGSPFDSKIGLMLMILHIPRVVGKRVRLNNSIWLSAWILRQRRFLLNVLLMTLILFLRVVTFVYWAAWIILVSIRRIRRCIICTMWQICIRTAVKATWA